MSSLVLGQKVELLPPGNITKLSSGDKLHSYSLGSGKYTFLFTAGFGSPSAYIDYIRMANYFSKSNRIFIYERLGVGWSDDVDSSIELHKTAEKLNETLEKSGESAPYILVAHSYGSLEMLHFASLYPNKVAAIILIDGVSPTTYTNFQVDKVVNFFVKIHKNKRIFNFALNLGLIGEANKRYKYLPSNLKKIDKYLLKKNFANNAMIETAKGIKTFADTVNKIISIKKIPLLVLSCKSSFTEAGFKYTNWQNDQKHLLSLSENSSQIFLEGKHSTVHLSEHDAIINAIDNFIKNAL
jgi:pimeloyl-ACP methyl ester carboxylesterase